MFICLKKFNKKKIVKKLSLKTQLHNPDGPKKQNYSKVKKSFKFCVRSQQIRILATPNLTKTLGQACLLPTSPRAKRYELWKKQLRNFEMTNILILKSSQKKMRYPRVYKKFIIPNILPLSPCFNGYVLIWRPRFIGDQFKTKRSAYPQLTKFYKNPCTQQPFWSKNHKLDKRRYNLYKHLFRWEDIFT